MKKIYIIFYGYMHQVKDNGDDYVDIATLDVYVNDPVILKDFFFLNI
jgi:hypothetical protein